MGRRSKRRNKRGEIMGIEGRLKVVRLIIYGRA